MKPAIQSLRTASFIAITALILGAGCRTPAHVRRSSAHRGRSLKPTVAVTDFENLSNFSGQWNLGQGMADLLVTQLLDTERVTVLERKHLTDVMQEILLQGRDLFRREGRVERGRLKNAKYLVRGSITDFTETARVSAGAGWSFFRIFGRGSRARVAINIKVSDVETGEIVSSVKSSRSVSAGGAGAAAKYKDLAFGGDAFFRTPLGRATEGAIERAVRQILRDLPIDRWRPRVAECADGTVIINGGRNMKVRRGEFFAVREEGREITDPETGNVIEVVPGRIVGRIRVIDVNQTSAHAAIVEGVARRGNILESIRK